MPVEEGQKNENAENDKAAETCDEKINDLIDQEFYHIKKAADIKKYITDIERSEEVDLKFLARYHNALRMKYAWYYSWHMEKYASLVHFLALGLIITFILILVAKELP